MARRVTSAEVARAAGVSRATVSYVLNGVRDKRIAADTWTHVLRTADRLGYRPSPEARRLQRGTSDIVLFLVPDWAPSEAVSSYLKLTTGGLARHGLLGLVHFGWSGDVLAEAAWESLTAAVVVAFFPLSPDESIEIERSGAHVLPVDWFHSEVGAHPGSAAYGPQRTYGHAQASSLYAAGHDRIAYVAPTNVLETPFVVSRFEGVVDAAAHFGAPAPTLRRLELTPTGAASVIEEMRGRGVTGVATFDDLTALSVTQGARRIGLVVPDDLAIVAVDSVNVAAMSDPAITAIAIDIEDLAARLVDEIVAAAGGARPTARMRVPALVHRGSL